MSTNTAIDLSYDALVLALFLAGPIMAIGMVVGLGISIFQAVTQLQEQTLSFVPKIVAMGLAAAFFIPWLTTRMVEYTQRLWGEGMWSP
ncbi:MAG: flagellar biosynthesis protein FliQ [Planctomycetia bacterium]|jgi:flagellar biosynthetic protein FliQ|nr:flagellar biosynthesis protein FliQ [Planctomycetia bacterium]MCC7314921.1 flagellar biosynthesis protein FliQ [Planctomycetota bacterium]OQZ05862.1 MAG: flagellar biosynthetic protein FliQ [Planctomycetes bacterium UTPLA1]OWY72445.1 flagellar biosynthetic protein FliQ [cyanobacterium TDX16]